MPSPEKPKIGLEDLQTAVAEHTEPSAPTVSASSEPQQPIKKEESVAKKQSEDSRRVFKRDGTSEPFNADRINRSIEAAAHGIPNAIEKVMQVASETQLTIYDGITTNEMDEATINAALQNTQYDLDYDKIATRILLKTVYKKVLGSYETKEELVTMHKSHFQHYIRLGVEMGLLDKRLASFDLDELGRYLKVDRDEFYKYSGVSTMINRYLVKDVDRKPLETPQYFWMRVAMTMALPEKKNKMQWAKKFYDKLSHLEYLSAGSTNLNAGTNSPSLSNCYLMQVEDDMAHIGKTISDVLMLSKATGGIGLAVTKLRANGSILKSSNTVSSGPIPFLHIIDSAIRAVQRGGKKLGALCFYMENWHYDFQEFVDLKQNAGDDYRRTRTANIAVYLSDEFMNRVKEGKDWYLFDPKETPELIELYGKEFSEKYQEYCEMADRGEIKLWKKLPAREQYKMMLVSLQTTSHPWITWKDPINVRALNNNTGTIHASNLCTEITLPQNEKYVAVCNLASLNLARHIVGNQVDWGRLEDSVRTVIRQLDNLIDFNVPPIHEARRADQENRAVGLGLMGLSDTLEQLHYSYEDSVAHDFVDKVFEFISYMAIDESANLAKERGSYKNFNGSGWSQGMVPIDTLARLGEERGLEVTVPQGSISGVPTLDWDGLRTKVRRGMRNATVLAVAPNANIGLVAGTSPGCDPRFTQMFSRNKISGKYLEVNPNLVKDMQKLGLWEKYQEEILTHHGDLQEIDGIPDDIKRIYKTSFSTSPYAFIEIAARMQKWVDQAISRNMYLDTRDINEVMKIYQTAWEKGLKTTYYLHMKPKHTAEQSTINVNKTKALGKQGFGALFNKGKKTEEVVPEPKKEEVVVEEKPKVEEDKRSTEQVQKEIPMTESAPKEPEVVKLEKEQRPKETPLTKVSQKQVNIVLPDDPQDAFICEGCE